MYIKQMQTQKDYTVGEWLDLWFEYYTQDLKDTTKNCYYYARLRIKNFCLDIEDIKLRKLTQMQFQMVINAMGKKYAKSSIRHVIVVYSLAYTVACENGVCPANPIHKIKIPKCAKVREVLPLTKAEQKSFEEALKNLSMGDEFLIRFYLLTGLRLSECTNLEWQDWDKKTNFIYVKDSKSENGIRKVPLLPQARKILGCLEIRNRCYKKSQYIFCRKDGIKLSKSKVEYICEKASKIAQIRHTTPHMLRHSFATRMVEKKVSIKALAQIMGHSDVAFTLNTYAAPDKEFLMEQIMLLQQDETEFENIVI
ncbi:tyrosine-type recombinase/integrase [Scatolibacter rhodanostii]|uniref:tyrosine-type recombinase/integrase n=1 Tax=Scatolibacter rhodanostii TaxID=2014781 RepID=UPI0013563546|nr:site-specific integrase [Scatolibacter rhodanostii]